jgi:SNF2 family DNA or RNA helicase
MVASKRMLNAGEMGVGKTPETLAALAQLHPDRTLIVGPKIAMAVWENMIGTWFPEAKGHVFVYSGVPAQRALTWQRFQANGGGVLITSYSQLHEIQSKRLAYWSAIVYDEAHILRNNKTQVFKSADKMVSNVLYLLTGSPVVGGPINMWAYLHLMDPAKFASFWDFAKRFCAVYNNGFGLEIGGAKDPEGLRSLLRPYMIRRLKKDVLTELPPKTRTKIFAEHTKVQSQLYDAMVEEMMAEIQPGEWLLAPSQMAKIMRLRQINVTPGLIGADDDSGTWTTLMEELALNFDSGNACVIFTPFAQAIPYIAVAASKAGAKLTRWIQGGIPPAKVAQAQREFAEFQDYHKVLISTIGVGSSWTATEASTALFVGYEWAPPSNLQAEDRIHRFGQTKAVNIKYLTYENTIDDHVLEVLDGKTNWAQIILDPQEFFRPKGGN